MSIDITGEQYVALYDSVSHYPLQTEVFTDPNEAEGFLEWAVETSDVDIRETGVAAEMRDVWSEYVREEWLHVFYDPIFVTNDTPEPEQVDCPLCGKPLGNETAFHNECADREQMQADLPSLIGSRYVPGIKWNDPFSTGCNE